MIVLLALLNSIIAAAIAGNSAATRVWFGMARSGSLPRALAKVHPKYKTPVNGVKLQILLTFAVGLGPWLVDRAGEGIRVHGDFVDFRPDPYLQRC